MCARALLEGPTWLSLSRLLVSTRITWLEWYHKLLSSEADQLDPKRTCGDLYSSLQPRARATSSGRNSTQKSPSSSAFRLRHLPIAANRSRNIPRERRRRKRGANKWFLVLETHQKHIISSKTKNQNQKGLLSGLRPLSNPFLYMVLGVLS